MNTHAKLAGALVTAGASILLTVGTAPAAHAAGDVWQYKNASTKLCLDSDAKGNVYTKACGADNPYQKWQRAVQDGKVLLRNVATRRCLWVNPLNLEDKQLETAPACANASLWWELVVDGTYRFVDPFSDKALDSNAKGNAYAKEYGPDNPYQQWLPSATSA
ncbi:RICIN domain-containing protein [Streptomyces sp. NRRL S-340]|uniref:RICIN domain-containing protein n=1 Tax=Streptomyces sp. NRRL S-340 TaxID=1463901 RepID=UPI00131BA729|nr:ricin-type beta-trefoil lectin domain protein [Streptomyces sp. NRRL S-340]